MSRRLRQIPEGAIKRILARNEATREQRRVGWEQWIEGIRQEVDGIIDHLRSTGKIDMARRVHDMRMCLADIKAADISSSDLRAKVKEGGDEWCYVPWWISDRIDKYRIKDHKPGHWFGEEFK